MTEEYLHSAELQGKGAGRHSNGSRQAECPQENGCATMRGVKISWQLRATKLSVKGSCKIHARQRFQLTE